MMGGTVAELVALVMSLHILRSLLKPLRRLQQEGPQWKKWSVNQRMNQRNWRRKKSLKKPKKLGDEF